MKKIYVDIKCAAEGNIKGYILDVSRVGFGLAVTRKLSIDTEIKVVPRTDNPLTLRGKVVYILKRPGSAYRYRVGVEFGALKEKQSDFLNEFILERIRALRESR